GGTEVTSRPRIDSAAMMPIRRRRLGPLPLRFFFSRVLAGPIALSLALSANGSTGVRAESGTPVSSDYFGVSWLGAAMSSLGLPPTTGSFSSDRRLRSEEHTSELQSRFD